VEWVDPLMAAGNWVPQLVEMAGAVILFGQAGRHAPAMTWEQLRHADPDVIVLMPCGFDLKRTLEDLPVLQAKDGWYDLKAVRSNRVYATDGNQYFNRPGPRLVESLLILAEILHPSAFEPQFRGGGWVAAG
jgi:iron complex transport system substrate-binding protein